jgi:valyl-tRNA synthetase
VYEFIWNEYCDWYVELAKVQLQTGDEATQRGTRRTLVRVLEVALRLAHPLIPFITEDLWQTVSVMAGKRTADQTASISQAPFPAPDASKVSPDAEAHVATLKELANAVRNLRSEMGVSPAEKVPLYLAGDAAALTPHLPYLQSLTRLSTAQVVAQLPDANAPVAVTGPARLMLEIKIDIAAERERLTKEKTSLTKQIESAGAKLGNEAFVAKAPAAVVDEMKKRVADFSARLGQVEAQLTRLG